MVYIVGGSGYVGTHLAMALLSAGREVTIVDPLEPPSCVESTIYQRMTGSDLVLTGTRENVVYWLAGPRNHSSPREVELLSHMLERDFERFCESTPRARVVLVSSMSIYDDPDNTYARHKRRMEDILESHHLIEHIIVRPGTVVGSIPTYKTVLRKDLGVHAVLRSLAETDEAWVNLELIRAYTTMQNLVNVLSSADEFSPLKAVIEAYLTVAPMSALFTELKHEGLHFRGDFVGTVNFNGRGAVSHAGLKEVQCEVVRTFACIRDKEVVWV